MNFSHLPRSRYNAHFRLPEVKQRPPVIEFLSTEEVLMLTVGDDSDYLCPDCGQRLCWYDPLDMWACPVCDSSPDSDTNPEMCGDLGGDE